MYPGLPMIATVRVNDCASAPPIASSIAAGAAGSAAAEPDVEHLDAAVVDSSLDDHRVARLEVVVPVGLSATHLIHPEVLCQGRGPGRLVPVSRQYRGVN